MRFSLITRVVSNFIRKYNFLAQWLSRTVRDLAQLEFFIYD
nr:MAG TPA: hypothetical protein [Caudoviricetes sp.]